MGYGDELMATGMARAARTRGKRIAFGDGRKIIWCEQSWQVFRNNPNIAMPGSEQDEDIEWINDYRGHRLYHLSRDRNGRARFNPNFRAVPGEVYLDRVELELAKQPSFDIVIEPNVKTTAPNKQWGWSKYQDLANRLRGEGLRVIQLVGPHSFILEGVRPVRTRTFRDALAVMSQAKLYVGPEGGLHHAAAVFNIGGVVIFGGFIHPRTTGYFMHTNLFVGDEPCGNSEPCRHCREAMESITVKKVYDSTIEQIAIAVI